MSFVDCAKSYFGADFNDHHVTKFFKAAVDPITKLAVAVSDIAAHSIDLTDASPEIKKSAHSVTHGFKDARVATALWNVGAGTIPMIFQQGKNVVRYTAAMVEGQPIVIPGKEKACKSCNAKEILKHEKKYDQPVDKLLCLISEICAFVGAVSYAWGFGVCRPIIFAEKHFKERVSASARTIGRTFGITMMINHVSGFIGAVAAIIRDGREYIRNRQEVKALDDFMVSLTKQMVVIGEKTCELGLSVIGLFKLKAPAAVRLLLALCAALLGVYKVWRDTGR